MTKHKFSTSLKWIQGLKPDGKNLFAISQSARNADIIGEGNRPVCHFLQAYMTWDIITDRPDAHNYKRADVLNEYIQKQLGEWILQ